MHSNAIASEPLLRAPGPTRPAAETIGDVTNVYINIEMHGISPSWRLELEGIFTPEEWNALIERVNRAIKRNPARYLVAFFVLLTLVCLVGFVVTAVLYKRVIVLTYALFAVFGLSTFAWVCSWVYMQRLKQKNIAQVLVELSEEHDARGITFRLDKTVTTSLYRRLSRTYVGSWVVVSFRSSIGHIPAVIRHFEPSQFQPVESAHFQHVDPPSCQIIEPSSHLRNCDASPSDVHQVDPSSHVGHVDPSLSHFQHVEPSPHARHIDPSAHFQHVEVSPRFQHHVAVDNSAHVSVSLSPAYKPSD